MPVLLTRRKLLQSAGGLWETGVSFAPSRCTRSFSVLNLLHPRSLLIRPVGITRLHCADADREWIVEGNNAVTLRASSAAIHIAGPAGAPVDVEVEIPGVLLRRYTGVFRAQGDGDVVRPVVTMDCEIAVGSIIGAELAECETPLQAMAAQAVVSRSVVTGNCGPRHGLVDFCDTTHCQFLRSPATWGSIAARALKETTGAVLVQDNRILVARYSAACGGHTEAGLYGRDRYSSVLCDWCLQTGSKRQGHGWGLCQRGAIALARSGWDWHAIVKRYYPEASVVTR